MVASVFGTSSRNDCFLKIMESGLGNRYSRSAIKTDVVSNTISSGCAIRKSNNYAVFVIKICVFVRIDLGVYGIVVTAKGTLVHVLTGSCTSSTNHLRVVPIVKHVVVLALGLFGLTADNDLVTENGLNHISAGSYIILIICKSKSVNAFLDNSYFVCEVKVVAFAINVSEVNTAGKIAVVVKEYCITVEGIEAIERILKRIIRLCVGGFIFAAFAAFTAFTAANFSRLGYFEIASCISLNSEHRKHSERYGVLTLCESVRIIVVLYKNVAICINYRGNKEVTGSELVVTCKGNNKLSGSSVCSDLVCREVKSVLADNDYGLIANVGVNNRAVFTVGLGEYAESFCLCVICKSTKVKAVAVLVSCKNSYFVARNKDSVDSVNNLVVAAVLSNGTESVLIDNDGVVCAAPHGADRTYPSTNEVVSRLRNEGSELYCEGNCHSLLIPVSNTDVNGGACRNVNRYRTVAVVALSGVIIGSYLEPCRLVCGRNCPVTCLSCFGGVPNKVITTGESSGVVTGLSKLNGVVGSSLNYRGNIVRIYF